jgi:hypothetical protein
MSDYMMYTDEPVEAYLRFPGFLEDTRVRGAGRVTVVGECGVTLDVCDAEAVPACC